MKVSIGRTSLLSGVGALLTVVLLVLQTSPATALPAGAPWYQRWSLPQSWRISEGAGVRVAVLDSGVKSTLGDLRGQVLQGQDFTSAPIGADHDEPIPGEVNFGHGTAMAALIAGTGRGAGLVGVAPKAKILPVRVGGHQGAEVNAAIKGIRWAAQHGAKVISMSFGGGIIHCANTQYGSAVAYAYRHDAVLVAAAGNQAGAIGAPGDCPGVVTIGGADPNGRPTPTATGSALSFVAPGSVFVPELLNDTLAPAQANNDSTSEATALAAGAFALLRAKYPSESARQIVARALATARGQRSGTPQRMSDSLGYGELNPLAALTRSMPAQAANPLYDRFDKELRNVGNTPPTASISSEPADKSSGSSKTPAVVVAVVVVAAALLLLMVVLIRRSQRAKYGR